MYIIKTGLNTSLSHSVRIKMSEKRKDERIKKNFKTEVRSTEHMTFSSVVDLSKGGIFISTPEPLGVGSEVRLSLIIPGGGEVELNGIVKWARNDETSEDRAGMGIEFVNISDVEKDKLETFKK